MIYFITLYKTICILVMSCVSPVVMKCVSSALVYMYHPFNILLIFLSKVF